MELQADDSVSLYSTLLCSTNDEGNTSSPPTIISCSPAPVNIGQLSAEGTDANSSPATIISCSPAPVDIGQLSAEGTDANSSPATIISCSSTPVYIGGSAPSARVSLASGSVPNLDPLLHDEVAVDSGQTGKASRKRGKCY